MHDFQGMGGGRKCKQSLLPMKYPNRRIINLSIVPRRNAEVEKGKKCARNVNEITIKRGKKKSLDSATKQHG